MFRLAGGQQLAFDGMYVYRGRWWPLAEDSSLDSVDDYAFASPTTLRWRSRRRTDPPFNATVLQYRLKYRLAKVVVARGNGEYVLDHDFAFPERTGPIQRMRVHFTVDPAWQIPEGRELERTSGAIAPGTGFIFTVPLRFVGEGAPDVFTGWRTPTLRAVAGGLIGLFVVGVAWLFVRERRVGRFSPMETAIDDAWLQEHVLRHPAEVVGAAWDENIGTSEVFALIARLVRDGVIAPAGEGGGAADGSTLRLVGDRQALTGYARDLVEALFFDGRTETSTDAVKEHYRTQGFSPVAIIKSQLATEVETITPGGVQPRSSRAESGVAFLVGLGLLLYCWYSGDGAPASMLVLLFVLLVTCLVAAVGGDTVPRRRHHGTARHGAPPGPCVRHLLRGVRIPLVVRRRRHRRGE